MLYSRHLYCQLSIWYNKSKMQSRNCQLELIKLLLPMSCSWIALLALAIFPRTDRISGKKRTIIFDCAHTNCTLLFSRIPKVFRKVLTTLDKPSLSLSLSLSSGTLQAIFLKLTTKVSSTQDKNHVFQCYRQAYSLD